MGQFDHRDHMQLFSGNDNVNQWRRALAAEVLQTEDDWVEYEKLYKLRGHTHRVTNLLDMRGRKKRSGYE